MLVNNTYCADGITGDDLQKAFVIGNPIDHSLSPILHNFWIKQHNIHAHYDKKQLMPHELKDFFQKTYWQAHNIVGCNVTIPYKIECMKYLDVIDDTAQSLGAVNTVYIREGLLCGANTDVYGLYQNLIIQQPRALSHAHDKVAVILGAGGAACAAVYALIKMHYRTIIVLARNVDKARKTLHGLLTMSDTSNVSVRSWHEYSDNVFRCDLLINCTSAGMQGQDPLNISLDCIASEAVIYDIVFKPLETPLLLEAKQRGHACVTGLGMLIYQAIPAFEYFFGIVAEASPALYTSVKQKALI